MADDYAHGRRDGLRLALAILAAEEGKWAALLGQSRSWRTNATREVRHKTLQVAQQRVRTALNRLTPKGADDLDAEVAAALDQIGLWLVWCTRSPICRPSSALPVADRSPGARNGSGTGTR